MAIKSVTVNSRLSISADRSTFKASEISISVVMRFCISAINLGSCVSAIQLPSSLIVPYFLTSSILVFFEKIVFFREALEQLCDVECLPSWKILCCEFLDGATRIDDASDSYVHFVVPLLGGLEDYVILFIGVMKNP